MTNTISSPLRIIILSSPETSCPAFLKDSSHHKICTSYYSASIPIWHDTLPTTAPTIAAFRDEWASPEAGEVIRAIGAWVVCFNKPKDNADLDALRSILTTIHEIIESHHSSSYSSSEPLLLAVGMQQSISPSLDLGVDDWDDLCRECGGWEWVDGEVGDGDEGKEVPDPEGRRNEYGEKLGIARLKEALEAHEWEDYDGDNLSDDLGFGSEDGFGAEAEQMEREMVGLNMAIRGGDGSEENAEGAEDGVEGLEDMMLKMQAIKDMGADMPDLERRRFAAKAVRDLMRNM